MKNSITASSLFILIIISLLYACKSTDVTPTSTTECGFAVFQNRKTVSGGLECKSYEPIQFNSNAKFLDLYPVQKIGKKQTYTANAYYYQNGDSLTVYIFPDGFPANFVKEGDCDPAYFAKSSYTKAGDVARVYDVYHESTDEGVVIIPKGTTSYFTGNLDSKRVIRAYFPLVIALGPTVGFHYSNNTTGFYNTDVTAEQKLTPKFGKGTQPKNVIFQSANQQISITNRQTGEIDLKAATTTLTSLVRNNRLFIFDYITYKDADDKNARTYAVPIVIYAADYFRPTYAFDKKLLETDCTFSTIFPNKPKGGRVLDESIDPDGVGVRPPNKP